MNTGRAVRRSHEWLLRRAIPGLDPRDAAEAAAVFEQLRADARRQSVAAWLLVWIREVRAFGATWRDERRRLDNARRERRGGWPASAMWYDLRQAARGLAREPLFSGLVVLTLALGIGANGATFELLDRLLLRGPEHVEDPGSLVRIYRRISTPPAGDQTSPWLPYVTYVRLRDASRSFDGIGAYGVRSTMVGRGERAQIRRVGLVLGAFFDTLGTRPQIGRLFSSTDDAAADGPRAVLSDAFWRSEYGGSPSAVGQTLLADGVTYTVVGVAPPGFSGADLARVDAWLLGDSRNAPVYNWRVVGRLRRGVSRQAAAADVAAIQAQSTNEEPQWMSHATLLTAPIAFDDAAREPIQARMARWIAAVSVMILCIACANVANLLLIRLARRRREIGIRIAVGGGRARIVALVAFEGLLLVAAGGVAAIWVGSAALAAGRSALFPEGTGWTAPPTDTRLLAIIGGVAALTAIVVAALPALQAGNPHLVNVLRDRMDAGPSRSRVRAALTILQAAVSVILLAGAGLFLRSLSNVRAVDLGLQPDDVIVAEVLRDRAPVPADRTKFEQFLSDIRSHERTTYAAALDVVRRLPGVEHASLTMGMPFEGGSFRTSLEVPGNAPVPVLPGGGPYISAVTPEYFATMGTRIVRGRPFLPSDDRSDPVAIVSQTTAARLWPQRDAIGSCVRVEAGLGCHRVVGIAQDVHRLGIREEPSLQVYVPFGQEHGFAGTTLLVRPRPDATLSFASIRHAIVGADPAVALVDVHFLSDSLNDELHPLRLGVVVFGGSALLALLTAGLGLYGLMSYIVAWRRREIGIRLALGATNAHIRRLVVGNGATLAAVGTVCGVAMTLACGPWIQGQLFETSASDPAVLCTVSAVLLSVSIAAGIFPARRALRIPPTESMRTD